MSQSSPIYSREELVSFGIRSVGHEVAISRKASIHGWNRLSVGHHVRIDDFTVVSAGSGIEIGNYVHISAHCALYGGSGITFEDYTGLSPRCLVFSESDDFSGESLVHPFFPKTPEFKPGYCSGRVILRRFAQTGAGTTILPGVTLGEGAVTGAHSLLNEDAEPWWIYVGVPARKLRERSRAVLALAERFQRMQAEEGAKGSLLPGAR